MGGDGGFEEGGAVGEMGFLGLGFVGVGVGVGVGGGFGGGVVSGAVEEEGGSLGGFRDVGADC